jgi:hypothetical protein
VIVLCCVWATTGFIEGPTVRATNDAEDRSIWRDDALHSADDLDDLLSRRADVSRRRLGSLGGLSSLSIRGARSGQTDLQIEGITLPGGLTDADVMRLIDPRIFGQVQFLLSGVQSLGGQIQLKAMRGQKKGFSGGFSLSDQAGLRAVARLRSTRSIHAISLIQDPGRFTYLDTLGTVDEGDDQWTLRRRNRRSKVNLLSRIRSGSVRAGVFVASLSGELAGSIDAPLHSVREQQTLIMSWLRQRHGRSTVEGHEVHLAAAHRQSTVSDPFGERFGLLAIAPSEGHFRAEVGAQKSGAGRWTAKVRAVSHQLTRINLRSTDRRLHQGSRHDLKGEFRIRSKQQRKAGRFVVISTHLALSFDDLSGLGRDLDLEPEDSPKQPSFSPRAALQIGHKSPRKTGSMTLAIVGRNPSPFERVGTYGGVLGNPQLKAEHGLALRADWTRRTASVHLVTGIYARAMRNLIDWVQTAPDAVRPINRGRVEVAGGLIRLRNNHPTLGFNLSYHASINQARVDAADEHPLRLAAQPTHRVRLAWRIKRTNWLSEWSVQGQSTSTLDAANLRPVGGAILSDWNAQWRPNKKSNYDLTVRLTNLFNRRVVDAPLLPSTTITRQPLSDVRGFPLPGRELLIGVRFPRSSP